MASILEHGIELSLPKGQLQFVHVKFDRFAAEEQIHLSRRGTFFARNPTFFVRQRGYDFREEEALSHE